MAEKKVVCVTGAGGFIASWIVKLLLERGYTVRGTLRDPGWMRQARAALPMETLNVFRYWVSADPKKTEHLHALDGSAERLQLFKADLLEEGSFDAIVEGCECVFHTASPFYNNPKDPQVELIDPAVKGTLNVLGSCKKASSVKRVILTSSMAAVVFTEKPLSADVMVDETSYSIPELCEKAKEWYVLSKTLAEQAAWKFSKDNGIDLVTINPAMVIGPLLQPTLNTSAQIVLYLISGSPVYLNYSFGWVNVKDVALAHVLAFETPSANGRYGMVDKVIHFSEVVKIIKDMYPSLTVPEKCADDEPFAPTYQVSRERITSLGVEFTPFETSLRETIECLKEKGFVSF
ncbi:Tetraketide alpha-pyrone reductase 1 [Dichanthelium oligosanthes]|uniref:Tetraketide alpha-pyrone reductase 1 n=1 Tax=Dichanthelium oligosanthes TaxID=888268 RepID=A0A1E5WEJ6_9POAL|nr:Tetraketide alpha-pyrone reductase 1 [Dichanthelium oligosanthes]